MGKNNTKADAKTVERTIFDELGIQPPKSIKVREMAEHVLSKTVKYARQNGSCSTGTANFLIDTLNIEGIDASELADRINKLGGVLVTVSFDVVTTASQLYNTERGALQSLVQFDNALGGYRPIIGEMGADDLATVSRRTRVAAATLLDTYIDYISEAGTAHFVKVSERPLTGLTIATIG